MSGARRGVPRYLIAPMPSLPTSTRDSRNASSSAVSFSRSAGSARSSLAVTQSRNIRSNFFGLYVSISQRKRRIVEELAYLAKVLVAGDGSLGRAWRPLEAAIRVVELCDAGLRAAVGGPPGRVPAGPAETLARWGATGVNPS